MLFKKLDRSPKPIKPQRLLATLSTGQFVAVLFTPREQRTKTASGRLWCRTEEPVPPGEKHAGKAQEMFLGTSIPRSRRQAVPAFAEGFYTEAKVNMVPIGVHPVHCWVKTSEGNVIHAVHFAA
eukprot:1160500-Pelagomonas_calceolata.AAC.1